MLQFPACSIRRGSFGGVGKWAEHLDFTVLGTLSRIHIELDPSPAPYVDAETVKSTTFLIK